MRMDDDDRQPIVAGTSDAFERGGQATAIET
jgi:hypothetical protein